MTDPPTPDRFRALLAAYGARVELWPERERQEALALLERSEPARELAARENALDVLLGAHAGAELSSDLVRRLAELPARFPRSLRLLPFRGWVPALAWAAAAACGVLWGMHSADAGEVTLGADTSASAAAVDRTADDDAELAALAVGTLDEIEALP